MKLSQAARYLKNAYNIRRSVFLTGEAGVGKSSIVKQVAVELGLEVRDVRAVLLDAVDIRGLPKLNGDDRVSWKVPAFFPDKGKGILFLDELNRAPQLVMNACLQLALDHQVGEYTLPDGWQVVAAGNPDSYRGVTRLEPALSSRFAHVSIQVDVNDFTAWAATHDIRPEVIAFIKFRPTLLHAYDRNSQEKAFPNPRSWQFVSEFLDEGLDDDIEHEAYAGLVGQGAAGEFVGFLKMYRSLPSLDDIVKNPKTAIVPKQSEPATLWAVVAGLSRKATKQNFAAIMTYAARLPKEWCVFLAKDASTRDQSLCETAAFIEFAEKNQAIMG